MAAGRKRKPIEVQEAKRRVHRSTAEKKERREREQAIGGSCDNMAPPDYLATDALKNKFSYIVGLLQSVSEKLCTDLDVDAVARYVLEEDEYVRASQELRAARASGEASMREIGELQRMKNAAFKTVDASAKSIGLTVDARLRLDLREEEPPKKNKFFDLDGE